MTALEQLDRRIAGLMDMRKVYANASMEMCIVIQDNLDKALAERVRLVTEQGENHG